MDGLTPLDQLDALGLTEEALVEVIADEFLPMADHRAVQRIVRCIRALAQPTQVEGGVYVASRASVPERGRMWRKHRDAGAPIVSTWIDEDGEGDTADLGELWARIHREVTTARLLVLYVEPSDFPLKGAFVEVGMALAAGVPIKIVAPGVAIQGRSGRPLGSWVNHPLVSFAPTVASALTPQNTIREGE